ncbi:MAG: dienelactone hydrolase family protein [Thiobacillus sp.]|nr:dienelactone hydrolase family protein [Thiobacillus sp.]
MKQLLVTLITFLLASAAQAAVQGKEVTYTADGVTMKGYLAWDDAVQGKRPGVLVVHEWWGHNDYARKRARMLAELGYTALAVDMYGEGKTASHPKEAGAFAGEVRKNAAGAKARFLAAEALLKHEPGVDGDRIGALGYCFGGSVVLEMARQGVDLKAVASYHGGLAPQTPAQPGVVKARVASFTGAADPMIPDAQVESFKREMTQAGVDFTTVVYPGVKHSFTNPDADEYARKFNMPVGYDAAADEDSWTKTRILLRETLGTAK